MTLTVRLFNNPNKLYGHKRNHSGLSVFGSIKNTILTFLKNTILALSD